MVYSNCGDKVKPGKFNNKANCSKCGQRAVIELQHGSLCKNHFINYFEDKVFKTINKFKLIGRKDKICVATSGGKDSLTVLYLTRKYCERYNLPTNNLFALVIDEGIENYRAKTIADLELFCKEQEIPLKKASFKKEFKKSLDEAYPIINKKAVIKPTNTNKIKDTNETVPTASGQIALINANIKKGAKKKPCNICGVWRRYLLNKYSRKFGATKIITGHNLDDEAQAIVMNLFKANTKLAGRLGPVSGAREHDLFVQRVKPLYFCTDKEVRLYSLLKGFQVQFAECPYSHDGYRYQIQEMLNDFEAKFKGTKQGIINSFLALLPKLEFDDAEEPGINQCTKCGEAANQEICNACKMREAVENARG